MLNLEMIDGLYASLPKEQQQALIAKLFKKSKQTMSYFHRTKDISLSKLETLADFFGMPLDYFRKDSKVTTNNATDNKNFVGGASTNTNLMLEIQSLRKELEGKVAIIKAKDETIDAIRSMNKMLKAQLDNNVKKEE